MSNMRLTGTASPLRSRRAAAHPQSATFFHLGNSGCHSALNDSSRAGGCNDAVRVNSDQYADARLTPKEQTELRDVHSPRFAMLAAVFPSESRLGVHIARQGAQGRVSSTRGPSCSCVKKGPGWEKKTEVRPGRSVLRTPLRRYAPPYAAARRTPQSWTG